MGEFLVNLFVRSDDRDAVAEAVKQILRPVYVRTNTQMDPESIALYVAPSIRGWVGIFDLMLEGQDEMLCETAVRKLSGAVGSVAISFLLHDGDFVRYWLGRDGHLLDRFHSAPDYFGPVTTAQVKQLHGRPTLLAKACGKPLLALSLARILRDPEWDGLQLLEEFCTLLDIPNLLTGFNTVEHDSQAGWVEGWESFRLVTFQELLGA